MPVFAVPGTGAEARGDAAPESPPSRQAKKPSESNPRTALASRQAQLPAKPAGGMLWS